MNGSGGCPGNQSSIGESIGLYSVGAHPREEEVVSWTMSHDASHLPVLIKETHVTEFPEN